MSQSRAWREDAPHFTVKLPHNPVAQTKIEVESLAEYYGFSVPDSYKVPYIAGFIFDVDSKSISGCVSPFDMGYTVLRYPEEENEIIQKLKSIGEEANK